MKWDDVVKFAKAAGFELGAEVAGREVDHSIHAAIGKMAGRHMKERYLNDPRGQLLRDIRRMGSDAGKSSDDQKKLIEFLRQASKNFTENDMVKLLCKLPREKDDKDGERVKDLAWLFSLEPQDRDQMVELLKNDGLSQDARRLLNILRPYWERVVQGITSETMQTEQGIVSALDGVADWLESLPRVRMPRIRFPKRESGSGEPPQPTTDPSPFGW